MSHGWKLAPSLPWPSYHLAESSNRTSPTHHFQQATSDLTIAQQGAHLVSWCVDGIEQLYLSPLAASDGTTPIRGGVPVCFSQFNMRGDLPKHGFARTLPWTLASNDPHPCFELCSSAITRLQDPSIVFISELDRIYAAAPSDLSVRLEDGKRIIEITQSNSLAHTVVWNPHAVLCRHIADLPDDGYLHYVCVEAAQVQSSVTVPAGDTWTGWQQLVAVRI